MDNQHIHVNRDKIPESIEKNNQRFHLMLLSDTDEMHEMWLPDIPEGFLQFLNKDEYRFLNIASMDGKWFAVCKKTAFFRNVPLGQSCEIPLEDKQLLEIDFEDRTFYLYTEIISEGQMVYHNYSVDLNVEINIGGHWGNDICYDNLYVSRKHAVLRRVTGQWHMQDTGSIYGVYVNGVKKTNANLIIGDLICIMGLRIIVGPNLLSVQCGSGAVKVNHHLLQDILSVHCGHSHYYGQDDLSITEEFFNRLPRKKTERKNDTITVESPPVSLNQNQIPLMLRLGSSAVMGGAAAMTGNFMTLISGVMFPFLTSKFTDKQRQEYEHLRLTKFREYLANKQTEIENACHEEHEFLNKKYPQLSDVVKNAKSSSHLWERRPGDSDFLQIRLGTGTQPLSTVIEYPPRHFELETDKLEEEMYSLVETPYSVKNAPIILSMADTAVCGLLGKREQVIEFIHQLVLQVSVFHSYDEVKTLFFINKDDLNSLDEIRYLPHAWDDQRTMRFIATDEAEAYKLGEYIRDRISDDKEGEKDLSRILKKRPFYLIFALDKKLFDCHEVMKDILQSDGHCGVSVITAFDDLLKESQKIITLNSNRKGVCTTMSADGGDDVLFSMDACDGKEFSEAMRILANTKLKTAAQEQELPKMITFLEMFNVGRIEQLNPLKRWQESNPVKSLATPVGVGSDGTLFVLDLHEKRQGPHGLVAGMTGSGKSEFLITYILSMAINYHPDEVAFVLIDYKGGGLADAFQNPDKGIRLPHLVGTITNLDGSSIQRSLMSIESELVRRQQEFKKAKSLVNEGTMDIYEYQKLYRAGKVSEPMPHLFIISDEFAELKQQQPEFMDKLISAARIGRSLGVHLILATQKPSGVVNDQIRSNTKFRVCLRVQERSDSMDMLKRPEAAELTDTGRFYLQVGYNEYFALGQSAWCGAPYEPQDSVAVKRDDSVEFLDTTGQVIARGKPKVKKTDSGMKQIVAVVKYLSELAQKEKIVEKQLWTEPLPNRIELNNLTRPTTEDIYSGVCATIGMVDDPEMQCQYPFTLDFMKCQHLMVIGNAGSGKTTLIKSALLELTRRYSPEKLNYYIIDCSGGTLGVFKKAPHCGAFLTENHELEVERFWSLLKDLIMERKKQFGQAGVTSYQSFNQISSIPLILVVVDNFVGLSSMKNGNAYFSNFHEYLRDTPNLGIKIVVSCNNLNELSMRSKQEINNRIALQMKDKFAYTEVLNCRSNITPALVQGRGLYLQDGRVLEYQIAIPFSNQNEQIRSNTIMAEIETIAERDSCYKPARKLPVVNEEENYKEFCQDIPMGRIPLGYELKNATKISIPLAQLYRASVYFGNPVGIAPVLKNFIFSIWKNNAKLVLVKRTQESIFDENPNLLEGFQELQIFDNSYEASLKLCELLIEEVLHRKNFRNFYCDQNNIPAESRMLPTVLKKAASYIRINTTPMFFLIEDFCEFSANMKSTGVEFFENIFENGKGYNFYFISCFHPESRDKLCADMLTKLYVEDSLMLFFGGQFQNQTLATLPIEFRSINKIQKKYNSFLMRYEESFYPLIMPCGVLQFEETDPDELPII